MIPTETCKYGTGWEDDALRHFSKHCIRGHNHSCNPGGQAPRPPDSPKKLRCVHKATHD